MLDKVKTAAIVAALFQLLRGFWPDLVLPDGAEDVVASFVWLVVSLFGVAGAAWFVPESRKQAARLRLRD